MHKIICRECNKEEEIFADGNVINTNWVCDGCMAIKRMKKEGEINNESTTGTNNEGSSNTSHEEQKLGDIV